MSFRYLLLNRSLLFNESKEKKNKREKEVLE